MTPTWDTLLTCLADWHDACKLPAQVVKRAAANVLTKTPVFYFFSPDASKFALHAHKVAAADFSRCYSLLCDIVGAQHVSPERISASTARDWVKLAHSPTIRRAGELLNFLPGTIAGIENRPSPVAAALTSALVGGGLGYTGGRLAEHTLPHGWQQGKLRKTMGLLGAAGGAALALPWLIANLQADTGAKGNKLHKLIANMHDDKGILSPSPFNTPPDAVASPEANSVLPPSPYPGALKAALDAVELPAEIKRAMDSIKWAFPDTFMSPMPQRQSTALDVNLDAMGRTLWDAGASPSLAATTMGALYAARQMPDDSGEPGVATGHQLGQLALGAGKNYLEGALVGSILNHAIGTPLSSNQFGLSAAVLGLIGTAVPRLYQ